MMRGLEHSPGIKVTVRGTADDAIRAYREKNTPSAHLNLKADVARVVVEAVSTAGVADVGVISRTQ